MINGLLLKISVISITSMQGQIAILRFTLPIFTLPILRTPVGWSIIRASSFKFQDFL